MVLEQEDPKADFEFKVVKLCRLHLMSKCSRNQIQIKQNSHRIVRKASTSSENVERAAMASSTGTAMVR